MALYECAIPCIMLESASKHALMSRASAFIMKRVWCADPIMKTGARRFIRVQPFERQY